MPKTTAPATQELAAVEIDRRYIAELAVAYCHLAEASDLITDEVVDDALRNLAGDLAVRVREFFARELGLFDAYRATDTVNVLLTRVGDHMHDVATVLHEHTGMTLTDAQGFCEESLEGIPADIGPFSRAKAEALLTALGAAGASAKFQ